MDFGKAMWKAVSHVFAGALCVPLGTGCLEARAGTRSGHPVHKGPGTYCFIRKVLCLPFLPAEHIRTTFEMLRDTNGSPQIERLMRYIDATWVTSSFWPVSSWSVYGQSVRTNNDVEGWHKKVNGRACVAPPFHLLVQLLAQESRMMVTQVQLVSEMKLRRVQRKSMRAVQGKIFVIWARYCDGEISTTGLLKEASAVYMPTIRRVDADAEDGE